MDLGKPGDKKTDAIGGARNRGMAEVVALLERFKENPEETRSVIRVELGLVDEAAAEMFALVVFVSDGLLQVRFVVDTPSTPAARFFRIATQLPLELQTILCYRAVGSGRDTLSVQDPEAAFVNLAKRLQSQTDTRRRGTLTRIFERVVSIF